MNFLYWNIYRKPLKELVAALASDWSSDVIILSENSINEIELAKSLKEQTGHSYAKVFHIGDQLMIMTKFPADHFIPKADTGRFSAFYFTPPGELWIDLNIFVVHLMSKRHAQSEDQTQQAALIAAKIREEEDKVGHRRSLIVGDFNLDPFEPGMVSGAGFHAVMSKDVARKNKRIIQGKEYYFCYNPLWSHYGDHPQGPPGTYFFDNSGHQLNYYWRMFDQLLVRPDLLDRFQDDRLHIVTRANGTSLLNNGGKPDGENASDHLPIVFSIAIEKGVGHVTREPEPLG